MASGQSQWITGPGARDVQRLRAMSCAVVTGVGRCWRMIAPSRCAPPNWACGAAEAELAAAAAAAGGAGFRPADPGTAPGCWRGGATLLCHAAGLQVPPSGGERAECYPSPGASGGWTWGR